MKLLTAISSRYYVNEDGIWTTSSYNYDMWSECLDSWDQLTVVAPCLLQEPPEQATRADGPEVGFVQLRNSYGALGGLQVMPKQFQLLHQPVRENDALVVHVPSDIGTLATIWARVFKKPYGLDVRGDQTVNIEYLEARGLRRARLLAFMFLAGFHWVRNWAACAVYVSQELKDRFPLPNGRPMLVFSDIRLPDWWFTEPRDYSYRRKPWRICSVGRLEAQKGYSCLLEACVQLVERLGQCFTLELIGNGPLEYELRKQAESLGLSGFVTFSGFVPWGPSLHERLLRSDLFVLSSVTEGMPRVVLEAMACGLPVISTAVGGVPEILPPEDLVPPMDITALTAKLAETISNANRMTDMSRRNCHLVEDFHPDRLRAGKQAFYRNLREAAEKGL